MSNLVITVESGSDLTEEMARQYGIFIVPMYVQFKDETRADGSFPVSDVCRYFKETGKVPKTSGSSPEDYRKVFDEIHRRWPEKKILHLAYSAVTTCSYQSARIAAEGRDYVACLDTKHVSAGLTAAVTAVARRLQEKEEWELREAVREAEKITGRVRMCFLPYNRTYLRAGGRCGNLTALCGNLLQIHPRIELLEGCLKATKKYRGSMKKLVPRLIRDYSAQEELERSEIWLLHTVEFPEEIRQAATETAREEGFRTIHWMEAKGVITVHGGPGAFAMAGYASGVHRS